MDKFPQETRKCLLLIVISCLLVLVIGPNTVSAKNVAAKSEAAENTTGFTAVDGINASSPIERPIIRDGTIYTAWGTLLRGLNVTGFVDAKQLDAIVRYGFNAAHYYIDEGPYWNNQGFNTYLGMNAERVDLLVENGEKNGYYVVITIGGLTDDPAEAAFLPDFWEFYAERYKDRKNVIFEIANEMWFPDSFGPGDPDLAGDAFRIIRRHAPDSMVLFYSFSHMTDRGDMEVGWEHCIGAIRTTEQHVGGISWTNEAVAYHGYEAAMGPGGPEILAKVIKALKDEGYPIINTELPNREVSEFANADLVRVCEEERTAWLSFLDISNMAEHAFWKGSIELANVTWTSDYGTWPKPGALYPYEIRRAVDDAADSTDAILVLDGAKRVYQARSGGKLYYEQVAFGVREPLSVTITAKAPRGAVVTVLEQRKKGDRLLAHCTIPSGEDYQTVTAYLTSAVSGLTNIVLRIESAELPVSISSWCFNMPPQDSRESFTAPYDHTVAAAKYSFRSGRIRRLPSDDQEASTTLSGDLKVGGITAGSYLEYDYVRFVKRDVTFRARVQAKAGGKLVIAAGDFKEYHKERYELGVVDISGTQKGWVEVSCRLNFESWPYFFYFGTEPHPWNLRLEFFAADGSETADNRVELFEISEFTFDTSGAPQTIIVDSAVLDGKGSLQAAVDDILVKAGSDADSSGYCRIRDLSISGTLDEDDFLFIRKNLSGLWTLDLTGITNTALPARALYNEGHNTGTLANLHKLTLPASLKRIGDYAFAECLNLATIGTAGANSPDDALTLPSGLTHIGEGAFTDCSFITADLSTTNVEHIGNWPLAYCERLEFLKLPSLDKMLSVSLVPPSKRLSAIEFTSAVAPEKRGESIGSGPAGAVIYYPANGFGYTEDWLRADDGPYFTLLAANTPPKVVSILPWRADSMLVSGRLAVTFDQPMKTSTVGSLTMNKRGGSFTPEYWTNGNRTCIIPYSGLDDDTDYMAAIQGFKSATGTVSPPAKNLALFSSLPGSSFS